MNIKYFSLQKSNKIVIMNSKRSPSQNSFQNNHQDRPLLSATPNKHRTLSTTNLINLSQYFAKRNTHPINTASPQVRQNHQPAIRQKDVSPQKVISRDAALNDGKQNMHPNINGKEIKGFNKQKEIEKKSNSKKKIITIKSTLKNQRQRRNPDQSFHGYSSQKRSITQSLIPDAQTAPFNSDNHQFLQTYSHEHQPIKDRSSSNSKHKNNPVIIELDLYKHRKSIQDTLVQQSTLAVDSIASYKQKQLPSYKNINSQLSDSQNCLSSKHQNQYCSSSHHNFNPKLATFLVKGKPFCDKCSANYITKGQLAIRIRNDNKFASNICRTQEEDLSSEEWDRNMALNMFIEKLDSIEPKMEELETKLVENILPIIEQQYSRYYDDINKWRASSFDLINKKHTEMVEQICQCHHSILGNLNEIKAKINEQLDNLSFMRTDIIQNINSIVKPKIVQNQKFIKVFKSFEMEFQKIVDNHSIILNTQVSIPTIAKCSIEKQQSYFSNSISINYKARQNEYLFELKDGNYLTERVTTNSSAKRRKQGEQNPFRLSFGKELQFSEKKESAQSPTFKMI